MDDGARRRAAKAVVARCGAADAAALVVVEGVGGTGKTGVLEAVRARRREAGLPTVSLRGRARSGGLATAAEPAGGWRPELEHLPPGTLVVVDDAQWLDDPTLDALADLADLADRADSADWAGPPERAGGTERAGVSVLLATRASRRRPVLARLVEHAARAGALVALGPLDEEELAAGLADLLGAPPHHDLLVAVGQATGGSPLLAACLVHAWREADIVRRGQIVGAPDLAVAATTGMLASRVGQLSDGARIALAALGVTGHRAVAEWLAVRRAEAYGELVDWGLARPGEGGVPPLAAEAARRLLEPGERARGEELVAALEAQAGVPVEPLAQRLWRSGSTTPTAAAAYRAAADHLLTARPRAAAEWYRRAAVADPSDGAARLGLLHAALAAGDGRAALQQAERLRHHGELESLLAATAAVYAARGLWADAAQRLGRAANESGTRRDWWRAQQALCAVVGGLAGADGSAPAGAADDLTADAATTLTQRVATALVASTGTERAHVEAARRRLREVAALATTVELPVDTAITPHEAGAALALAAGDVAVARRLLAAAPTVGLRAAAVARLASWAELRAGEAPRPTDAARGTDAAHPTQPPRTGPADGRGADDHSPDVEPGPTAESSTPAAGGPGGETAAARPRRVAGAAGGGGAAPSPEGNAEWADLVGVALEAVATHRAGDVAGGAAAARRLAATLPAAEVDLANFDPVCELIVLARRFGPGPVAAELDGRLVDLLARLGWPPLWTARFRWARLEAAVATRDVAELETAAEALATMADAVPAVTPLAEAAAVWREVMSGHPDQQRVEQAVAALQDHGLAWEASQLAGQAAIRIDDAAAAKSLLGRARALRGEAGAAGRDDSDRPLTRAGLSEREVEVARLVLDGLTHRDIGATLYISPKTVEHHVAHIRTKLGVTNRAEFLASLREDLAARVD